MKIYGDYRSGNCYKLKLVAALLDLDLDVDTSRQLDALQAVFAGTAPKPGG